MTGRAQVDALTGVRGIAAWLVVLYHIRLSFAPSLPEPVVAALGKGYLAVDLFFVLSGFVLWMTWGPRLQRNGWRASLPFMQKRIARVWPLHAVILAATVGLAFVIAATGRPLPESYRWQELPLHILLVQNWGFTSEIAWNDPSWSISTELAAYLLFALIVPMLRTPRGFVLPLVAIAVCVFALDRFLAFHGERELGADIAYFGLTRCLAQFGCGIAMCMIWQVADERWFRIATAGATIALTTAWFADARETFVMPLAFAALTGFIASTSAIPRNPLSSRFATWLGDISYSTYLAHFLLWKLFKLVFVSHADNVPVALGALYLALALLASVLLYRLVEVPARDRLGRPFSGPGNRAPA